MYTIGQEEIEAVGRAISSRQLFRYGAGQQCATFEKDYAAFLGLGHARLTCSGSYALHAGLVGLGIGPGDEVLVPAHTYMATATSVLSVGAIPVIVDVNETLTIDPVALEDAIGPQTRAVIPVHMWGAACDMNQIMRIARKHDLKVLEDACQGVGGGYDGKMLGAIGDAGAYSFNYYKNMSAGESGCVVTNDRAVDKRAACAIDPCHFYWTGRDEDFLPFASNGARASEILGAVMNVQLARIPGMISAMREERKMVLAATDRLHKIGLKPTPMNSPDYDCGTHVMYSMPSAEAAIRFSEVMPSVIAGKTGRHTYKEWDQIILGQGAGHPAMNPYLMEANKNCRKAVTKDMYPRSLAILDRTVMLPTNPDHTDEEIAKIVRQIEVAAKYALGHLDKAEAEKAMTAIDRKANIDLRLYDADVEAYGFADA